MTAYEEVNAAVNEIFFLSGRSGNQPVYLDIEDDVRGVLSDRLSVEPSNLDAEIGRAVAQTIVNGHRGGGGPYVWHIRKLRDWLEAGRSDAPPFTAFLCALSIAAERMRSDSNFSANNYYQRLFEILGVDDERARKKLRSSARYTRWFWRALNQWLEDHDHRFGRPTARTVNNAWKYVGYAVSQALIRDADRKKLHGMFVQFGFSPHEKFSEPEMQLHLADWMSGHGSSPWLKRLWSNPDLRERISNTALVELETWDGTELGGDKPRSRLRWSARQIATAHHTERNKWAMFDKNFGAQLARIWWDGRQPDLRCRLDPKSDRPVTTAFIQEKHHFVVEVDDDGVGVGRHPSYQQ